jgi:hypothetical protein
MATLAVLVVVFLVVGLHKNDQINSLKQHGVRVVATVSTCTGLLGGSGSNAAGYSCTGTFTVDGHSYTEVIPGTPLRAPGSTVTVVADPTKPGLFTTVAELNSEHASANVLVVPAILLVVLLLLVGVVVIRRRSKRHEAEAGDSA